MTPTDHPFTIDAPRPQDAPALARVHVEGWRVAYGHLLPERWFGADALLRRTEQWTRWLTPEDPAHEETFTRIGRDREGLAIGFATAGPCRDQDGPRDLELASLYIDPTWLGTGLGRALVEAVIGAAPASVWVAEQNPRARRFYTKLGFAPDGAARIEEHLGDLRDIRMVR